VPGLLDAYEARLRERERMTNVLFGPRRLVSAVQSAVSAADSAAWDRQNEMLKVLEAQRDARDAGLAANWERQEQEPIRRQADAEHNAYMKMLEDMERGADQAAQTQTAARPVSAGPTAALKGP